MLANLPRRHVRRYQQQPTATTPSSVTLPSPRFPNQPSENGGDDDNHTLFSSSFSRKDSSKDIIVIHDHEAPERPTPILYRSVQPVVFDTPSPRVKPSSGPGVGLPKRRTLAQRVRERRARRCLKSFPSSDSHGAAWHMSLADPNLDGYDKEAEEGSYNTIIRILESDDVSEWEDPLHIRLDGGRVHLFSATMPPPPVSAGLSVTHEPASGSQTEIHLFIPRNVADAGVTALTLAQMQFAATFPQLGKVLVTTPPDRGVDAISLAALHFKSPEETIMEFNASLDTPLDTPADEASWKWRGAVSWDGIQALIDVSQGIKDNSESIDA